MAPILLPTIPVTMDMIYMVWVQESACMMAVGMERHLSVAQGEVSHHSHHFSCNISI